MAACEKAAEQTDPPIRPSNTLSIRGDGSILWNGTKIDADTFTRICKRATQQKAEPEIHVQPDRLAKYDAVAQILTEMQRDGCTNIGFTGIDNGK